MSFRIQFEGISYRALYCIYNVDSKEVPGRSGAPYPILVPALVGSGQIAHGGVTSSSKVGAGEIVCKIERTPRCKGVVRR